MGRKTYSDSKQSMWETWFVASFIIVMAYLCVGTMEGTVETFPNWSLFACLSVINLLVCLYKGLTNKY